MALDYCDLNLTGHKRQRPKREHPKRPPQPATVYPKPYPHISASGRQLEEKPLVKAVLAAPLPRTHRYQWELPLRGYLKRSL